MHDLLQIPPFPYRICRITKYAIHYKGGNRQRVLYRVNRAEFVWTGGLPPGITESHDPGVRTSLDGYYGSTMGDYWRGIPSTARPHGIIPTPTDIALQTADLKNIDKNCPLIGCRTEYFDFTSDRKSYTLGIRIIYPTGLWLDMRQGVWFACYSSDW